MKISYVTRMDPFVKNVFLESDLIHLHLAKKPEIEKAEKLIERLVELAGNLGKYGTALTN